MTMILRNHSLLATLLLAIGACADATSDEDLEFRDSGDWPCTGCTLNSPSVNDFGIPELDLDFGFNEEGVRLLGIISPTLEVYRLDFTGAELFAKTAGGDVAAAGPSLVGWRIWLETEDSEELYVHIRGYSHDAVESWADHDQALSGYAMAYEDPEVPGRFLNVCPEALENPDDLAVTVLGGETYDHSAVDVNEGTPRWFTLACRAEAAYKLKALGYGPNFVGGTQPSTADERRAALKMIVADYCGTGQSHTTQGTEIAWMDARQTVGAPAHPPGWHLEAYWTASGASCVSARRHPEIPLACARPLCNAAWPSGTIWTTWSPPTP